MKQKKKQVLVNGLKFKAGDWVIGRATENEPRQIAEVTKDGYKTTYGGWIGSSFEEDMRLWTIEDAKDGDVLFCPSPKGYEADDQIFIFQCIGNRDYVDNCIEYYCRVCDGKFYVNKTGYMGTIDTPIYPATKEQLRLLFQKMEEANYIL